MRRPYSGETVGLQFGSDALAFSPAPSAARPQGSQQVLHVMPVFVGQDVSLGKPPAFRAEPRLKLLEEARRRR